MRRKIVYGGAGALAALGLIRWQLTRWFTEEPRFEVERRLGRIDIRRYPELVRAQIEVPAFTWREALNHGFQRLADYIFGANQAHARIAMTAPVTQGAERIDTTAPGLGVAPQIDCYQITFTMPSEYTLDSLPRPDDAGVHLETVPPRRIAALRYAGSRSVELLERKTRELLDALAAEGIETRGEPEYAGYDPPWTLPLLRRNEVWVELA